MRMIASILLSVAAVATSFPSFAHPGRTASDGCHYCRTNCGSWGVPYGQRHCHGGYKVETSLIYFHPHVEELKVHSHSERKSQEDGKKVDASVEEQEV
jgi:hypothetical protein